MHLPSLRQLMYLTEVVKHQHFSRAAEQCFVTQSTLSTGIQDLEALLGVQLLERTNRSVIVTGIGQEIAERAQHILSLCQDLVSIAQQSQDPLAGRIRIGIIPTISPFLLPKSLPLIRAALPNLEILLFEDTSTNLLTQLHDGTIDLAVLAFPFEIKGLRHTIFSSDPYWVALPPQHPLVTQQVIDTKQIAETELLLLTEEHCLREHVLAACHLPISRKKANIQGTSLYTLIEMVANGLGITLIPEIAINSEMIQHAHLELRKLVKGKQVPKRKIGLVWRHSYPHEVLIDTLCQYFSQAIVNNQPG